MNKKNGEENEEFKIIVDTIKIKFSGMGGNFEEKDNFITKILQERYVISVEEDPDFLFYFYLFS